MINLRRLFLKTTKPRRGVYTYQGVYTNQGAYHVLRTSSYLLFL